MSSVLAFMLFFIASMSGINGYVLDNFEKIERILEKRQNNCPERPLRIGSFNIQIFGDKKYGKEDVVEVLLKILKRYDIVLVMEIKDYDGSSFRNIVADLEKESGIDFEFEISERLGDGRVKEQYAFLYRPGIFKADSHHTYSDPKNEYDRPPFAVKFTSDCTEISEFILAGIHTKPDHAKDEIDHLTLVYMELQSHFKTENIAILGDFNAGCSYVKSSQWDDISFRTDARFKWLILDDIDTTVAKSDCSYDRIVVGGSELIKSILPKATVFRFDEELDLNGLSAKKVSDHYPVEFELYNKGSNTSASGTQIYRAVEFDSPINQDRISDIRKELKQTSKNEFTFIHPDDEYLELVKSSNGISGVLGDLQKFHDEFSYIISDDLMKNIKQYDLKSEFLNSDQDSFLIDVKILSQKVKITIKQRFY